MVEERPPLDAHSGEEETTLVREERTSSRTTTGSNRTGLIIVGILVVFGLIVAGLFLPPISLGQRLAGDNNTAENDQRPSATSVATDPSQMTLALNQADADVEIETVAVASFLGGSAGEEWTTAANALPAQLSVKSDLYTVAYEGTAPQGTATLTLPAGSEPHSTLDLYGWNGQRWQFVASQVDAGKVIAAPGPIHRGYLLAQTATPAELEVGAELLPTQSLPAAVLPTLTEITVGTLTLNQGGRLDGNIAEIGEGGYRRLVRVTNTGVVVDQPSLAALLSDTNLQSEQIAGLVQRVRDGGYAGVNLDYQGVSVAQRDAFSQFVANLADALHAEGLTLAVTLATPFQNEDGSWNSEGQDWVAIGRAADTVYAQMPLNPASFADGGPAEQLITWATRQVDRYKLTMLVSALAIDGIGDSFLEMSNEQALANFGSVNFIDGAEEVEPGAPVEVGLSGSASALAWDVESLTYRYTYEQAGQEHTVWLGNEAAVSHRIRLASRYNLRGVALRGLNGVENGNGFAAALQSYLGTADAPQPTGAAIVWTIADESGGVVASNSGDALTYRWEDTNRPGVYTIAANFAQGDNVANLGELNVAVKAPEPTPTPEPTATPEPTDTPEATAGNNPGTAAPSGPVTPGSADAAASTLVNIRTGPGLGYPVVRGEGVAAGTQLTLIGRNSAADWIQVRLVPEPAVEGWILRSLLTINANVNVNALAVVEVDPPAGGTAGSGAPPPVGAPPVAIGGAFEIGGQTHSFANPSLMAYAGMNWVKFQHKWGPGDDPSAVAGRIQQAHGSGFKVLLSIPGSNVYPSSIEFGAYVDFLGGVAALGPDAIEVWNEMNIDFEWPAGQIDPASYVNNMLAPAYNRIKSVNPSVMVISGAPAPTGFDNGTNAWADNRYMAGLAAAGGASYMDCIGVHYNAGATSPNAQSGHPAGGHYSWYFWGTLNMYYNALGGSRPVCFTELGYLSGEDYGGVPSRFAWAGNTSVNQHAQWLAEAVSLSGSSGKVRLLIVFNVDFTHWGDDPQAGYAMIRANGSCPACDALHNTTGGR